VSGERIEGGAIERAGCRYLEVLVTRRLCCSGDA
jgi:hypothetical protein